MHERSCVTIDCDYVFPAFAAAFLRVEGDEAAFIETNTALALPKLLGALETHRIAPAQIRWIVVTHAHLDHAAGTSALLQHCPNATVLAHPRAARHLIDPTRLVASATQVYGKERFAALYGEIAPIDAARVKTLEDGDTFALGGETFRVHHTRGHANHHFIVHDPALGAVYTGDAFGLAYPALQRSGPFAFPSTSPTDFDAAEARASIDKIVGLGAHAAFLTHFGEVNEIAAVAAQLRGWIDVSEESMLKHAREELTGEALEKSIESELRAEMKMVAERVGLVMHADDWALLETDLRLNAQGLAWVAAKQREKKAKT